MANLPDKSAPDLSQYLPARKSLVEEKLVELAKTEMPTVGQLLGLILEEDRSLLKLAHTDTTGKISSSSADADRITGQITATDNAFRTKVITPNIAPEQILAATSAYKDSLAELEAQRLKVSGALGELESQAQQLKNAKTHSGKLESGLSAVIEKVGDRPIPPTILAALFGFGQEKPPAVVEQTALPTVDLDQIALRATTEMASLHTRKDDHLLAENITVSVKSARSVGRPNLSGKPTPIHFKALAILREEGVDLSELVDSTNAQGITMALKALLRKDVGIEPTVEEMEQALRGIVRGEYKEVLDNRKTLLALNGLAKPRSAPAKIETLKEPATLVKRIEEITPVTKAVGRDAQPFDPKPKELKRVFVIEDDDPLAMVFTKIAKNGYLAITEPGYLAAAISGKGTEKKGRISTADQRSAMTTLDANITNLVDQGRKFGLSTLGDLANSDRIKMPDQMRSFFREKCPQAPIGNLAIIDGQIRAGYHQEKAKTLDQLALKIQKMKLSGK